MTQEEKQLLLKDLCARVPYETKCAVYRASGTIMKDKETIFYTPWPNVITFEGYERNECYMYWQVKPYLRPMSSMTEEEKIELCTISYAPDEMKTIEEKLYVIKTNAENAADFYNKHHFDYRNLIEKGLALEAPEGMYKTE